MTPFGLVGAPVAFQRWVNSVLGNLLGDICAAYLDDVVIFSSGDKDHHWSQVKKVLSRLESAGLKHDPKKYEFATKEIKYLGFIIQAEQGINVDKKIEAIKLWEPPKNIKAVRHFLGFADFFRKFFDSFATLAALL